MQGKEIERNVLAHRWCLIPATMPIVFMSEMVLSHLSSMVESSFSSLWLMHGQIVSRENSTGLGHDGEDIGPLGCKLILPSSHVGSPRFMTQLFQDAMAICRHFHKPDLFLTITANPK